MVIGLVLAVSGCIFDSMSTYQVSDSQFELQNVWKKINTDNITGNTFKGISFSYNGNTDLILTVKQYFNKNAYSSAYNQSKNKLESISIPIPMQGVPVTLLQYESSYYSSNPEFSSNPVREYLVYDYYFQKNGKYYVITFEDYKKDGKIPERSVAVSTIINSMK